MVRVKVDEHRKWLRTKIIKEITLNFRDIETKLKESMLGLSYNFFASSQNYPIIAFGPTLALNNSSKRVEDLYRNSYKDTIKDLAFSLHARRFVSPKFEDELKFLAMSSKEVYVETIFSKKPRLALDLSEISPPIGPRGTLRKIEEQENLKIPRRVYSLYEEKVKAKIALEELYSRNFDVYYLSKILSSGVLGLDKKITPTRWAITATDSTLSKFNIELIKDFKEVEKVEVYLEEHFFNKFVVLLIPGEYEFENFEAWAPKTTWASKNDYYITEEYENHKGRKRYPYSQAGAYFAVRLAITEFLRRSRRKAKIIVFREVSEGYSIPLGVWHVRETVRKALEKKPEEFPSVEEAIEYIKKVLTLPIKFYLKKSRILGQRRILDYIV